MTSESAGFRAISKRSVPLIARRDLVTTSLFFRGVRFRAVKDPIGLKYFHLQPEQYLVLDLLDGHRSLEDIRDEVQREFPTIPVSLTDVQSLTTDLHQKGLALGT
ncbi:MAG: PqqD family peptide modification chaperone, partial [Candidatus Anammoximicrobium sp.]|nr:PqqD family peptide modification chaperone [Candidatus Anammoximicrobium sp.]